MYPGQNKFLRLKNNLNKEITINKNIYSDIQNLLED
jgi:LDH2 family malate/lactate/ureidoglycolate dehydrogenase